MAPIGFSLLASTPASHTRDCKFQSGAGLCLSTHAGAAAAGAAREGVTSAIFAGVGAAAAVPGVGAATIVAAGVGAAVGRLRRSSSMRRWRSHWRFSWTEGSPAGSPNFSRKCAVKALNDSVTGPPWHHTYSANCSALPWRNEMPWDTLDLSVGNYCGCIIRVMDYRIRNRSQASCEPENRARRLMMPVGFCNLASPPLLVAQEKSHSRTNRKWQKNALHSVAKTWSHFAPLKERGSVSWPNSL